MATYIKMCPVKGFDIYFMSQGRPVSSVVPNQFAIHDFKTEEEVFEALLLVQTQCIFMDIIFL